MQRHEHQRIQDRGRQSGVGLFQVSFAYEERSQIRAARGGLSPPELGSIDVHSRESVTRRAQPAVPSASSQPSFPQCVGGRPQGLQAGAQDHDSLGHSALGQQDLEQGILGAHGCHGVGPDGMELVDLEVLLGPAEHPEGLARKMLSVVQEVGR